MSQAGSTGDIYPSAKSSGAQADDVTPGQVVPWQSRCVQQLGVAAGSPYVLAPQRRRADQLDTDTFIRGMHPVGGSSWCLNVHSRKRHCLL